ncbi:MAG: helix-turn-helix domain-containing protein [Dehalococcoidia bacterium]|nr:MAG: helix-turn-helix domain-containing protein [Dehalococcoidia bacterium]
MLTKVMPTSMLTVGEVARILHIHENTVRRWSDQGVIKSYRFGVRGERRFEKVEVESVIARLNKNNSYERISL